MAYWLFKSEPSIWSWDDQVAAGAKGTTWTGARMGRPGKAEHGRERAMAYWLFKSEPSIWSWDDQVAAGAKGTTWNGVRNHQAKQNLMAMKRGDQGFFYHSNEGKAVVGIVEVIKEYYPDPTDETGKFGMVDLKAVEP